MRDYAQIGTRYYIIFDPDRHLKRQVLQIYGLTLGVYEELERHWLPDIGLGLALWEGVYEGGHDTWLRWCDQDGNVIPTSAEYAEQEHQRAEQERQRAERLLEQLRALGVEPQDDPAA
jgi:mannose/cellobiose epimerase-like protein (N-acyl-D-glucosamine 2-epimerase family)